MNDLKQLLDSYNICARFAPGFLFVSTMYFLLGYDIKTLQNNRILFVILLFILSGVCGFSSASLIKIIEKLLWKIKNPTILYLSIFEKDIYRDLLKKHNNGNNIITYLLEITRDDNKLFWKNVAYGFFRNSILLSLVCLYFSHSTLYFNLNLWICISIVVMTFVCSVYYAEQVIKSYQEKTYNKKKN